MRLSLVIALCAAVIMPSTASYAQQSMQAGNYLAGRFAQSQHDWKNANIFINKLMDTSITPANILQRAMILSMGSGDAENAIKLAKQIKSQNPSMSNTIIEIFLITEAFKQKDYKKANSLLDNMPDNGTTKFITPFIEGWLAAAQGNLDINNLRNNTAQLYHAILISDFLDNHKDIEKIIDKSLNINDINIGELERVADLYAHVGLKDKALGLYREILSNIPEHDAAKDKIEKLEKGLTKPLFKKLTTANNGMAKAFYDIAAILHNEENDESARVFSNVALYLNPKMTNPKFLLADINTSHKQYGAAISYYKSVPKSDSEYLYAQHKIVDIYEDMERFDEALSLLKTLLHNYDDVDSFIKMGDLHRNQSNFGLAIKAYDNAIDKIGGTITEDYWHLHYMRGIAYEQMDNWKRAEEELQAALTFQPDHPYILNYLGYAWADKGVNLQKSLEMIKRAVALRPSDGYITDSLGWVMYRVKDYKNAVPVLERAAQLLPYDPTVNDHLGDAYLKVGRVLEAKFQWQRAVNHSDDQKQIKEIKKKLSSNFKNIKK